MFTTVFILKNIIRIAKPESPKNSGFSPKIVFLNESEIKKIKINDFIYTESTKMCGYGFAPCTHYLNKNLKSKKYKKYKVILVD